MLLPLSMVMPGLVIASTFGSSLGSTQPCISFSFDPSDISRNSFKYVVKNVVLSHSPPSIPFLVQEAQMISLYMGLNVDEDEECFRENG
jgi:hypothetical protein